MLASPGPHRKPWRLLCVAWTDSSRNSGIDVQTGYGAELLLHRVHPAEHSENRDLPAAGFKENRTGSDDLLSACRDGMNFPWLHNLPKQAA